jgi:hypothetical protein
MRLITTMFSLLLMTSVLWARNPEKHALPDHEIAHLDISLAAEAAWSPDLSLLAVLTGPTIEIWDAERWQLLHTIQDVYAYHMQWHPDRNDIAALSVRDQKDEVLSI